MWCSVSVLSELRWTVFCAHGRARDVTPSHEAPRDSVPHQSGEESGSLCLLNGLRFSGFGDVYLIQAVRLCRAVVNHFFKRNWLLLGWKVFSSNPQAAPVSDLTHSGAVCVTEPRTNGGAHRCGVNGKCSISASLRVSARLTCWFYTSPNSDRSAWCSFTCWTRLESWDPHSWIYRTHHHSNLHDVQPGARRICWCLLNLRTKNPKAPWF